MLYNRFVNTMSQQPTLEQLLPLPEAPPDETAQLAHHWDYLYEPEAKDVLDGSLTRYIESLVYRSVVENLACEQSARMVAMKSASDNAGALIDELKLRYNKAAPGGDHTGNLRDRRRRRGGVRKRELILIFSAETQRKA